METLEARFSIRADTARRELHWHAQGLFDETHLKAFQKATIEAIQPFIDDRQGFNALADLRDFAVQTRAIAAMMEETQMASTSFGGNRMAVICKSVLVKQQFRRVSEVMEIEFFDSETDALRWLRR